MDVARRVDQQLTNKSFRLPRVSERRRRPAGQGAVIHRLDGRWEGRYSVEIDGHRVQRSVYAAKEKEAVAKLAAALGKRDAGMVEGKRSRVTLADWLDAWLAGCQGRVRPTTYRRYADITRLHLSPALGSHQIAALTPQHVNSFLTAKLGAGLAPRSVAHLRAVLRTALDRGDGGRPRDPQRRPARPPRPRFQRRNGRTGRPRTWRRSWPPSPARTRRRPSPSPSWRGSARGKCSDCGGRTSTWRATPSRSAGPPAPGRRAGQPAPRVRGRRAQEPDQPSAGAYDDRLAAVLTLHRCREEAKRVTLDLDPPALPDYVFTSADCRPLEGTGLTKRFERRLSDAGLAPRTWHDLRHGFASRLADAGVDLLVISRLLGHSGVGITATTYTRDPRAAMAAAVARLG